MVTHKVSKLSTHRRSHNITARRHRRLFFGEGAHDERDDLRLSGNWPTLDNSSRLKRHTWSAPQPSAGAMGVWCIDPPPEQPLHRPGLDSVQVAATYAVISEPVPNYASPNVFTAWDKAPFDSQGQSRAVWRQHFEGKSRVKDGNLLIGETRGGGGFAQGWRTVTELCSWTCLVWDSWIQSCWRQTFGLWLYVAESC